MRKIYALFIILITLIVFIPKDVGGPLCGPVCFWAGLHYYEVPCFGFKVSSSMGALDTYTDFCFGLPFGDRRCFGVPYNESGGNSQDIQLDCDYPCNDDSVKTMCQTGENVTSALLFCDEFKGRCDWKMP